MERYGAGPATGYGDFGRSSDPDSFFGAPGYDASFAAARCAPFEVRELRDQLRMIGEFLKDWRRGYFASAPPAGFLIRSLNSCSSTGAKMTSIISPSGMSFV